MEPDVAYHASLLQNETQCQLPIIDFAAEFTSTITEQLPEWGDEMWVATEEAVNVNMTKVQGDPVHYFVDWYGGEYTSDDTTPDEEQVYSKCFG